MSSAINTDSLHALAHEPVENYRGYGASNARRGHCVRYVTPDGVIRAGCIEQLLVHPGHATILTVLNQRGGESEGLAYADNVPFSATPVPHSWHYWGE